MTAAFTRRVSQQPWRLSRRLSLSRHDNTGAGVGAVGATAVHLPVLFFFFITLSVHVAPTVASDRSLCFKMPPANTMVLKPELMTDASKVWRRGAEERGTKVTVPRLGPPLVSVCFSRFFFFHVFGKNVTINFFCYYTLSC